MTLQGSLSQSAQPVRLLLQETLAGAAPRGGGGGFGEGAGVGKRDGGRPRCGCNAVLPGVPRDPPAWLS